MKTMTGNGEFEGKPSVSKKLVVVALATALLLMVPLVAMQFTNEVKWDLRDFSCAGVLVGGTGIVYVLSTRKVQSVLHRALICGALAIALFLVWAQLAVGLFSH